MRFSISKKTLVDRRAVYAEIWELIALNTGRHVNGEFVRRCIAARFDTITHYPNHDGSFDVEFTKHPIRGV